LRGKTSPIGGRGGVVSRGGEENLRESWVRVTGGLLPKKRRERCNGHFGRGGMRGGERE